MKTIPLLAFFGLLIFAFLAPGGEPVAPATEGPAVNYTYNAKVVRVLAGDRVALDVDLGFGVWLHNQTFKLQGVPTPPDLDGADRAAALNAKTKAQSVLSPGAEVLLQSIKDKTDKSGVYHAVLWLNGENLNAEIAKEARK
jgi:endonuclease YncB( thermonuclease family)